MYDKITAIASVERKRWSGPKGGTC